MKTASDPRHLKRQKIIQELFAWQEHQKVTREEKPSVNHQDDKTKEIISHLKTIDKATAQSAPEWEIEKINNIDLAILRLAIFELLIEATEPSKVVIDEAVELAKEFGSESSPSFVNGALGKVLKSPQRLKKIISTKLGVEEERLTPETNLTTDLNTTKFEISDLVAILEKEYNIEVEKDVRFNTVGDLLGYLEDQIE